MDKKRRNDIILIAVCLFAALAVFGICRFFTGEGDVAHVTVDGKEYGSYPLNKDVRIAITSKSGTNTLVIENGRAYVTDASCPDKLCEKMHSIKKSGESIVCLPNKVVVTVESDKEGGVDLGA